MHTHRAACTNTHARKGCVVVAFMIYLTIMALRQTSTGATRSSLQDYQINLCGNGKVSARVMETDHSSLSLYISYPLMFDVLHTKHFSVLMLEFST